MKKNFHQHGLKVFVGYYGPHWKMFAIDMLCAIVASVIDLVFPYISRNSMQTLLPQGLFGVFFAVMGIMIVAYFLKVLLYYIITVVGHRMGTLVEADMRSDIFSHMQSLSFSFFDHNRIPVDISDKSGSGEYCPASGAKHRRCASGYPGCF